MMADLAVLQLLQMYTKCRLVNECVIRVAALDEHTVKEALILMTEQTQQ